MTATEKDSVATAPEAAKKPIKATVKAPAKKVATPRKVAPASVAKPVVKAAPSVPVKSTAKAAINSKPKALIAAAAKPAVQKLLKAKKLKLVRDSFAMPKLEYHVLEELKLRSGKLGNSIKKSELIRAGIKALASLPDSIFLAALKAVPTIKTGRPAKK